MGLARKLGRTLLFVVATTCFADVAAAQPAPAPAPAGAAPVAPKPGTTPPPTVNPGAAGPAAGTGTNAAAAPTTPVAPDMMAASTGGITAEQVGARAAATSYQAKAAEESANAAQARAEASWTNFLPRLGLTARYTRLSEFKPPSFSGGGALVGTNEAGGTCLANCPPGFPGPVNENATLVAANFAIPLVFNQWLLQATIAIPISDYFLKINQAYTASLQQEEAARYDIQTARAKSLSDGKIAYFTWLRTRGSVVVANQNLTVAKAHLKDAENQFTVGNASKADVLRSQTQVAAAELAVTRAQNGVIITEKQVRIATHAKDDEKLEPGESLDSTVPPAPSDVRGLISEAHAKRPEIKSVDKNAIAARKIAEVQNANKLPALSAFGDATYANPNPRRFPQTQDWFPTWAVGAQLTWNSNDLLSAGPQARDAEARAAALDAQKNVVRDGIELEVTQAYQQVLEADAAIITTTRQLESAEEGYRVASELFKAGRGTSTTLIDAEQALAQTRFEHLNAKVDARLARIRLEHAVGRDVR